MNWYYESAGSQQGPVTDADLDRLLTEGKITLDTLVWREGMNGWTPLRSARPSAPTAAPSAPAPLASSDAPQPGHIRCTLTGQWFPPSEIFYQDGKPYSAAAKPQLIANLQASGIAADAMDADGRSGPAWEQRASLGWFKALVDTTWAILSGPTAAFTTMKRTGGLQTPLMYYFILGTAAGVFSQIVVSVMQFFMMSSITTTAAGGGTGPNPAAIAAGVTIFSLIFGIIMVPIQALIGAFIGSGITHVCMMIVKTRFPYETTFRTTCYLYGATAPVQVIATVGISAWAFGFQSLAPGAMPNFMTAGTLMVGALMLPMIIWYIYMATVALAAAHEVTRGRALLAILLPMIACCGFIAIAAVIVAAVGGMN